MNGLREHVSSRWTASRRHGTEGALRSVRLTLPQDKGSWVLTRKVMWGWSGIHKASKTHFSDLGPVPGAPSCAARCSPISTKTLSLPQTRATQPSDRCPCLRTRATQPSDCCPCLRTRPLSPVTAIPATDAGCTRRILHPHMYMRIDPHSFQAWRQLWQIEKPAAGK